MSKNGTLAQFLVKEKRKEPEPTNDEATVTVPDSQSPVSLKKQKTSDSPFVPDVANISFKNLEDLLEPSWREKLKDEFTKPYWSKLKAELAMRKGT